jgi:Flp pilus assembly protein TadG
LNRRGGIAWRLRSVVGRAGRRFASAKAGVALIVALTAPMLLGITGLSVDIGYWYQQQTQLQTAADAAALAAAQNDQRLAQSTAATKVAAALPFAEAAADNATNGKFGFASGAPGTKLALTAALSPAEGNTTETTYTAVASAPRRGFFSRVTGMGLSGILPGLQATSATAAITSKTTTNNGSCLMALDSGDVASTISNTGTGTITATNCSITDNSSYCQTSNGAKSGSITGGSISEVGSGSISASTVQTVGCADIVGSATVNQQGSSVVDNYSANNNYNLTDYLTAPQADPLLDVLGNPPSTVPSAKLFSSNAACSLGNTSETYTVPEGPCAVSSTLSLTGTFDWSFTGGSYDFANGFSTTGSGTVAFGSGTYIFNGAVSFTGSGPTSFAGGTYFFEGGLSLMGSGPVTFGPGIYYFGTPTSTVADFQDAGSGPLTINGATLVLEGTGSASGFDITGSISSVGLSAPSSNCVALSAYPEAQYVSGFPYDGTDGEGICGLLIYQARNDPGADTLTGSEQLTNVTGIIYAPDATFTATGSGTIAAAQTSSGTSGGLAVLVNQIDYTGSGTLQLSQGSSSPLITTTTTNNILLVR